MGTLSSALDMLRKYEDQPARERNYHSAIWAGLLAGTVRDLAGAVAGPGGNALSEAYDNGADRFAYETAQLIRELSNSGHDASDVLRAVEDTIAARMEVGLPEEGWFSR